MTNLRRVLKGLKKMGIETQELEYIKQTAKFLGSASITCHSEKNFNIEYFKNDTFKLEASWSNQEISAEWLEKARKLFDLIHNN